MRKPKTLLLLAAVTPLLTGLAVATAPTAAAQPALSGKTTQFSVLAADGAGVQSVQDAVRAAGGTVVRSNAAVGLVTATAPRNGFTERLRSSHAVLAAAPVTIVGHSPTARPGGKPSIEKHRGAAGSAPKKAKKKAGMDPLDYELWGLTSVRSDLARTKQAGSKKVKVGIIDTGVDGTHPDIAPNFDMADSRNFVRDIPYDENGAVVDGPCEFRGCVDPANHDDGGHGTHVAGTIAAAANGFGISGVAPNVTIVNVRAGQDSGYFFLQSVVDALTYSGDAGLDVVNMSFYVDPWLFNCDNNPADTPEQQAEQRVTKTAVTRAMNYAYRHGVTQVVALGNEHENMASPQPDLGSPNFPAGNEHDRQIDNATCQTMPTEGPHSIGVGAFGPSQAKADYSNYGTEQISVSAPGGWYRDYFGTPEFRTNENMILSTYPRNVGVAEGNIDADGNITPQGVELGVQKACKNGSCGYYQYLQGTSMAAPHATGVAALIVSQYGKKHGKNITMNPDKVQRVLEGTAAHVPCPTPRTVDYLDEGRDASYTATCTGGLEFNDFYGHGAIDAYAAVTHGKRYL